jgi:hypothetical protein
MSEMWSIVELKTAKTLYAEGLTLEEVGQEIGRPAGGVRHALKSAGVELRLGRPRMADPWSDYDRRVREDSLIGSQKLLAAIQRAGVRP